MTDEERREGDRLNASEFVKWYENASFHSPHDCANYGFLAGRESLRASESELLKRAIDMLEKLSDHLALKGEARELLLEMQDLIDDYELNRHD